MQRSGFGQHRLLVQQLRVCQPRPAPGGIVNRHTCQAVQQQRGGRCVGNAHFTKSHHVAGQGCQHVGTCLQGGMELVRRHGRAGGQVVRAVRDFAFDELRVANDVIGQIAGHASINYMQCKAMLPR